MRSCCRSVCFLLLMDSNIPPRVSRAWQPIRLVVYFGPWCINRLVSQPLGWSAQGDQATVVNFLGLYVKGGRRSRKWPLAYRPWLAYKTSTEAGDAQSQQLPSLVGLRGGRCRRGPNSYLVSHGFFRKTNRL
ncbi:hypothetical protein AVEN_224699-1 [Araneus ventricosus]|uniref:Uncharacterized protein n=1 Tax=Araneus ventricosus TaxID=182803 RepID=A0A4Y2ETY1_ARAVE|nr:hypothetical protein AVEN_224699-1 [Araneus ventricosus]